MQFPTGGPPRDEERHRRRFPPPFCTGQPDGPLRQRPVGQPSADAAGDDAERHGRAGVSRRAVSGTDAPLCGAGAPGAERRRRPPPQRDGGADLRLPCGKLPAEAFPHRGGGAVLHLALLSEPAVPAGDRTVHRGLHQRPPHRGGTEASGNDRAEHRQRGRADRFRLCRPTSAASSGRRWASDRCNTGRAESDTPSVIAARCHLPQGGRLWHNGKLSSIARGSLSEGAVCGADWRSHEKCPLRPLYGKRHRGHSCLSG